MVKTLENAKAVGTYKKELSLLHLNFVALSHEVKTVIQDCTWHPSLYKDSWETKKLNSQKEKLIILIDNSKTILFQFQACLIRLKKNLIICKIIESLSKDLDPANVSNVDMLTFWENMFQI